MIDSARRKEWNKERIAFATGKLSIGYFLIVRYLLFPVLNSTWQYQYCSHSIVTMEILLCFSFSCQIQVKRNAMHTFHEDFMSLFEHLTSFCFLSYNIFSSFHFIHTVHEITTHAYTDFVHNIGQWLQMTFHRVFCV